MLVSNTLKYKQCLCIWILQRNVMHNLYTRLVQFTDQKKYEMVQTAQIEFFISGNTTRSRKEISA